MPLESEHLPWFRPALSVNLYRMVELAYGQDFSDLDKSQMIHDPWLAREDLNSAWIRTVQWEKYNSTLYLVPDCASFLGKTDLWQISHTPDTDTKKRHTDPSSPPILHISYLYSTNRYPHLGFSTEKKNPWENPTKITSPLPTFTSKRPYDHRTLHVPRVSEFMWVDISDE